MIKRVWVGERTGDKNEKLTVVDDTILQQSLTQVNPFFWVVRFTDFHQPGHKLTGRVGE